MLMHFPLWWSFEGLVTPVPWGKLQIPIFGERMASTSSPTQIFLPFLASPKTHHWKEPKQNTVKEYSFASVIVDSWSFLCSSDLGLSAVFYSMSHFVLVTLSQLAPKCRHIVVVFGRDFNLLISSTVALWTDQFYLGIVLLQTATLRLK